MPVSVDVAFPLGVDAEKLATKIAVGQSAGSWDPDRFSAQAQRLSGHLATVVKVEPEVWNGKSRQIARIEFPDTNWEGDLGTLMTMIFGKFSMAGVGKVIRIELPEKAGITPRFGMDRLRELVDRPEGPLIMGIFKPALGLNAKEHAAILEEVGEAGLDIIKDDEILGDLPSAPMLERVKECAEVLERLREKGKKLLYAVNITGRADVAIMRARNAVACGANALLVNGLSHGLSLIESLASDPEVRVPIFLHPATAGALCAAPDHGYSYGAVLGTLYAHSGADAVLYPSALGNLPFSRDDEHQVSEALRARGLMPVPSAGIHPGVVPQLLDGYGSDVALNAGTGIMDHPDGPGAGVAAFHEAVAVYQARGAIDLADLDEGPLKRAVEKWGPR